MGSGKSEMASVQPLSAPACFSFPLLKTYGKGRPEQETKGCRTKLSPSFAAVLEVSLRVSVILLAFEEELESVN